MMKAVTTEVYSTPVKKALNMTFNDASVTMDDPVRGPPGRTPFYKQTKSPEDSIVSFASSDPEAPDFELCFCDCVKIRTLAVAMLLLFIPVIYLVDQSLYSMLSDDIYPLVAIVVLVLSAIVVLGFVGLASSNPFVFAPFVILNVGSSLLFFIGVIYNSVDRFLDVLLGYKEEIPPDADISRIFHQSHTPSLLHEVLRMIELLMFVGLHMYASFVLYRVMVSLDEDSARKFVKKAPNSVDNPSYNCRMEDASYSCKIEDAADAEDVVLYESAKQTLTKPRVTFGSVETHAV